MHNDLISVGLIESFARLDLQEHRLLDFCLAHYDSRKEAPEHGFDATVKDLVATFPGMNLANAYAVVQRTVKSLGSKPLEFREQTARGRTVKRLRNWFGGMDYWEDEGRFTFYINPQIEELLLNLKDCFTAPRLAAVRRFRSPFARKLYQLVKRWEKAGKWVDVNLDELRAFLGVAGKYPRWQSFKTQIDKGLAEINEVSDLTVSYQMVRWCRQADRVTFYIETKKPDHDQADIEVENQGEALEKALVKAGIRIKTAERLVAEARTEDKVGRVLARLPRMIELANSRPPADRIRYLTGAVQGEIDQRNFFDQGLIPPLGQDRNAAVKDLEKKPDAVLEQLAACDNLVAKKILAKRRGEECSSPK
jgi:plasmid replication initiation protein